MANTSWWPKAAGHSDQRHKIITGAKWLPKFMSGHTSQPLGFLQFGLLCLPDCGFLLVAGIGFKAIGFLDAGRDDPSSATLCREA